ncbi:uncharacterized protein LOC115724171 isoform X1 [Cannabis sativa]|uniref:uncharacterized protein LOC115724171 isoform X1 n=1 Tax=Cannabis sativa TaxID=3483 RepID=UPI0029C9BD83|nr:uncharacterized protein LOC115724171 isoform X1 [Cannabis sativa]XP_030509502.2 uncharacterized protein LOC115724171 isoform X1 [Cannabis sativa]XP_060959609.1 uncharacterized protein LOC115724171 isoform X1 [Cannabis sativa]XP_060959610.1 uncharacterized protein LOC115724171 isoform X1 [Cannabis sativa]
MVVLSHSTTFCSGFIHHSIKPTLLFQGNISCYNGIKVVQSRWAQRGSDYVQKSKLGSTCVVHMARREPYQSSFEDNLLHEPFLLTIAKEAVWWMRSLFIFLSEQPGQLMYIEWPSFPSTLKTATLTLVLVALLIVALSSVDSALSYLLAVLTRRAP